MKRYSFVIIYPTFKRTNVVKKILPSIIDETTRCNAGLIVIDNSILDIEKSNYLLDLRKKNDFFLLISDNTSYAHTRNLGLHLAMELYSPEYICILDDDHGVKEGFINIMTQSMKKYYGTMSPNGLLYGLFSACHTHDLNARLIYDKHTQGYYPELQKNQNPTVVGGGNGCCRCATTAHWCNVLKGYDTDEYVISNFQSSRPKLRNYHKGFTCLHVGKPGQHMFDIEEEGRGESEYDKLKLWDKKYTKSDLRSIYFGKSESEIEKALLMREEKYIDKRIKKLKKIFLNFFK